MFAPQRASLGSAQPRPWVRSRGLPGALGLCMLTGWVGASAASPDNSNLPESLAAWACEAKCKPRPAAMAATVSFALLRLNVLRMCKSPMKSEVEEFNEIN